MNRATYSIATMCCALDVYSGGCYALRNREPSARAAADAALTERIRAIHRWSGETYGAPLIHEELRDEGWRIGRKRVTRLMGNAGIAG